MSTGRECEFVEVARDKWYYILEDHSAPQNAWDWRDHATACGPFPSMNEANKHLGGNHGNPGGATISGLPDGQDCLDLSKDETLKRLIDSAVSPEPKRRSYGFGFR